MSRTLGALLLLVGAAGCTAVPENAQFHDPYEETNRQIHAFNRGVDKALLRPSSQAYGVTVPRPVKRVVGNVAGNLDQPGYIVNDILQGQVEDAGHNTFRFLINSTLGVAGLFDPATSFGLEERASDFGQTLHVWGAEEGAYVELPFLGPSTTRDTWGKVVDAALNPVRLAAPDDALETAAVIGAANLVGQRDAQAEVIDALLYESADSYAQARLLYLQNRRFTLGGPRQEEDYFDPFADPALFE